MRKIPPYIIMGTYEGSKYIYEMIKSIQDQEETNWKLIIRDDGSTDGTLEKVAEFVSKDDRIALVEDAGVNLGVVRNYRKLMEIADNEKAEIIFFADQDDVWLPNKIKLQMRRMKALEKKVGNDTPILIHSDLIVVDEYLRTVHESFMKFQGIQNESGSPLNILLVQNFVTGCSMAINQALLKEILPIPGKVVMHDWWIAICAAAFGIIDFIHTPTVLYRQHRKNTLGAKSHRKMLVHMNESHADRFQIGTKHLLATIEQAKLLSYKISLKNSSQYNGVAKLVMVHATCLSMGRIERVIKYFHAGIRRQKKLLNILLYLRMLIMPTLKDKS